MCWIAAGDNTNYAPYVSAMPPDLAKNRLGALIARRLNDFEADSRECPKHQARRLQATTLRLKDVICVVGGVHA